MTDEQLQEKIESGQTPVGKDAVAYQKVFNALQKEPYQLPVDFADRLLVKLEQKPSSLFKEYFWMAAGWFILLLGAVVSIQWISFKFTWANFRFLAGYSRLAVLALLILVIVQRLDKRLLKSGPLAK